MGKGGQVRLRYRTSLWIEDMWATADLPSFVILNPLSMKETDQGIRKICYVIIAILLFVVAFLASCGSGSQKSIVVEPSTTEPSCDDIPYEIVQTEDFSYAGCLRVGYRITVPDEISQEKTECVMQKLINRSNGYWQDITVWAWGESEKEQIGETIYTKGMAEYSTCK